MVFFADWLKFVGCFRTKKMIGRFRTKKGCRIALFICLGLLSLIVFLSFRFSSRASGTKRFSTTQPGMEKFASNLVGGRSLSSGGFLAPTNDGAKRVRLKERIVHFDLKGAPPRVEYLLRIFQLRKRVGATDVLLDYEDMLPYSGKLEILKNGDAYSRENIETILSAARSNRLSVIPLIQTFGHMEWVLKHKEFSDFREIFRYPQVSCPSNNRSREVIKEALKQVVALHPGITALHIGADEAYYVGKECGKCRETVEKIGKDRLMLKHVSAVARYTRNSLKIPRVLMWHDMFKSTDPSIMKEYDMGELVEPVIWAYREDLESQSDEDGFPPGMFERFRKVFPRVWAGSSFKGANGPAQTFVNVSRYLANHISWLRVINQNQRLGSNFHGIVSGFPQGQGSQGSQGKKKGSGKSGKCQGKRVFFPGCQGKMTWRPNLPKVFFAEGFHRAM